MVDQTFEEQFLLRQYVETKFGLIETYDIQPEKLKSPIPVFFAPGWRETPELQKQCLYELYKNGRRVIGLLHTFITYKPIEQNDLPVIEAQKAQTLLTVLLAKSLKRVDVVTHSEGAINVAIAASIQPKLFRNLVLITPAGLTGKDRLTRVAFGFARHMIQPGFFSTHTRISRPSVKRKKIAFVKNLETALNEGKAITSFDIHPLLLSLLEKDIKIAVLCGEKDTVFPLKRVTDHLSKIANPPHYGFSIFATKPGGHEVYSKPAEVMGQVEEMLQELESL